MMVKRNIEIAVRQQGAAYRRWVLQMREVPRWWAVAQAQSQARSQSWLVGAGLAMGGGVLAGLLAAVTLHWRDS